VVADKVLDKVGDKLPDLSNFDDQLVGLVKHIVDELLARLPFLT
jgi:hypothetical protein